MDVKKKKRLLAIRVKEKSHVEHFLSQMLASVGLRQYNNLDFALPWLRFLPSLGPFPPHFSAHICFTGLIRMKPPSFTTISGSKENGHRSQEKRGNHVCRQGPLTWGSQQVCLPEAPLWPERAKRGRSPLGEGHRGRVKHPPAPRRVSAGDCG